MSTNPKSSKPLPVDDAAVQQEAERRAALNGDGAYRRGVAQAEAQERSNASHALTCALADLKRVSLKRDTTVAGRDSYDRTHNRVVKAAERVASILTGSIGEDGQVITDPGIDIPAWLAPPVPTIAATMRVGAPRVVGGYRESKGMGASGKGGPLPDAPGTDANEAWLNVQGMKP